MDDGALDILPVRARMLTAGKRHSSLAAVLAHFGFTREQRREAKGTLPADTAQSAAKAVQTESRPR